MTTPSPPASSPDDPDAAELDRLYEQALEAMDAIETDLNRASEVLSGESEPSEDEQDGPDLTSSASFPADDLAEVSVPADDGSNRGHRDDPNSESTESGPRVTPRQIIEAVLFVGGGPRTTKKLRSVLGSGFDVNFVDQTVESLNRQYAAEGRPYEIRFGEGGYRMELRQSFESVRNRVFGFGPKEVKLSRDALEVLALVAYRQPISPDEIEQIGKPKPGGVLRHLLRRELVAIERGESGRTDVRYTTTPRFLRLFGLSRLDELPQAEDVDFK